MKPLINKICLYRFFSHPLLLKSRLSLQKRNKLLSHCCNSFPSTETLYSLPFLPYLFFHGLNHPPPEYRSKPSLAAVVGCMMPLMLGFCFLCPSMDCLWHKYHYCPKCKEKVRHNSYISPLPFPIFLTSLVMF